MDVDVAAYNKITVSAGPITAPSVTLPELLRLIQANSKVARWQDVKMQCLYSDLYTSCNWEVPAESSVKENTVSHQWRTEGVGLGGGGHPTSKFGRPSKSCQTQPDLKTVKNYLIYDANAPRCSEKRQHNSKTTIGSQLFYISNDK